MEVGWGIGTGRLWAMQMKRRRPKAITVRALVAQVPLDTQHQAHSLTAAFDKKKNRQATERDSRAPKRPVVALTLLYPAVKVADLPNLGTSLTVLRYSQEVSDVGVVEKDQG